MEIMNRDEMLKKVQMLSFVLVDVDLFLDTHPDSKAALNYHEKYAALYQQAKDEYEAEYGPLTCGSVNIKDEWSWINNPWPWEMEG